MSSSKTPNPNHFASGSPQSFGFAMRAAVIPAIYFLLVCTLFVCEAIGSDLGYSGGSLFGLPFVIALVAFVLIWFGRSDSDLAAALGPLLALLVIIGFFAFAEAIAHACWPDSFRQISFWTVENLRNVAVQWSLIAMAALGMTLIIIAGGIDLSVGTAISLCATLFADCLLGSHGVVLGTLTFCLGNSPRVAELFDHSAVRIGCGLVACMAGGLSTGLLNGVLVSSLRIVPFIVTLGTMTIFVGLGNLIGHNTPVRPPEDMTPFFLKSLMSPTPWPHWDWLVYPFVPNFAWGVWLVLAMAGVLAVLLHCTVFGRHVFALGSNEATARLCGVRVSLTKIAVYGLAGLFVGLTGFYSFGFLCTGDPESGRGLELRVIAAVIIGGGSLSGGRGSVMGTLTGAAIMYTIENGCRMLHLSVPIINIIIGTIIIVSVWVDQYRQRQLTGE